MKKRGEKDEIRACLFKMLPSIGSFEYKSDWISWGVVFFIFIFIFLLFGDGGGLSLSLSLSPLSRTCMIDLKGLSWDDESCNSNKRGKRSYVQDGNRVDKWSPDVNFWRSAVIIGFRDVFYL